MHEHSKFGLSDGKISYTMHTRILWRFILKYALENVFLLHTYIKQHIMWTFSTIWVGTEHGVQWNRHPISARSTVVNLSPIGFSIPNFFKHSTFLSIQNECLLRWELNFETNIWIFCRFNAKLDCTHLQNRFRSLDIIGLWELRLRWEDM